MSKINGGRTILVEVVRLRWCYHAFGTPFFEQLRRWYHGRSSRMKEAKMRKHVHTPGPWSNRRSSGVFGEVVEISAEDANIAVVFNDVDARLVTAAPDLLTALEGQLAFHKAEFAALSESGRCDVEYYWRHSQHQEQIIALTAVIAKAT